MGMPLAFSTAAFRAVKVLARASCSSGEGFRPPKAGRRIYSPLASLPHVPPSPSQLVRMNW
ncbi:hypothetical protein D3C72_1052280 [compost metagenome]